MKKYLKLTSVALALFLTSQSVQAMENDKDKSTSSTVQPKPKTLGEIMNEHKEAKQGVISNTLQELYLWLTGQTTQK